MICSVTFSLTIPLGSQPAARSRQRSQLAALERLLDRGLALVGLITAGYRGDQLFSAMARRALYRFSGGTPRLVNILAHKAMLASFGEGRLSVGYRQVFAAARDTEGSRPSLW